jgi:hypothetical protein
MPSRATERINFGKIKEIIAPPNLIELQTSSYKEFLQAESPQSKRKNLGLQAVFTEVFPIESYDGKVVLDFHSYDIGEPKVDWLECLREGLTYGAPLYVTFLLKDEKGTKEEKVFMGELPLMTPQGTFVINGAERVIVSQLHRSPGIAFEATQHPNGKMLHSFRVIPDRGSWYEAQFDTSDLLYVYLDRKKRRRKFFTTTLFRALAFLDGDKPKKPPRKTPPCNAAPTRKSSNCSTRPGRPHHQGSRETRRPAEQSFDPGRCGRRQRPGGRARLRTAQQSRHQANRRTRRQAHQSGGYLVRRGHHHQVHEERPGQERGRSPQRHLPPPPAWRSADRRQRQAP